MIPAQPVMIIMNLKRTVKKHEQHIKRPGSSA